MARSPQRVLSREAARRIAVRAGRLDAVDEKPRLGDLVADLTMLPLNPTTIVVPTAEHIAHTRIADLHFDDVRRAVEVDQSLFEHLGPHRHPQEAWAIALRSMRDAPWLTALGRAPDAIHEQSRAWLDANAGFERRVMEQLHDEGPLPQSEIENSSDLPFRSSGWNTNRDVAMMLELLQIQGRVVVSERVGTARSWDLAERVLPNVAPVPPEVAEDTWRRRWLASLGVARPKHLGDLGIPVTIEGTRGEWRLDPDASAEGFVGRVVVLCPIDRLIADRRRMAELFEFEYALEQYTPAAKRRWGAYALPILDGDRLVGKVDARTDRAAGVLEVNAVHWDVTPDARLRDALADELARLAAFIGVALALP